MPFHLWCKMESVWWLEVVECFIKINERRLYSPGVAARDTTDDIDNVLLVLELATDVECCTTTSITAAQNLQAIL